MPPLVAGKSIGVLEHNASKLTASYAVIDTALGNDVAKMIEFECLRISHGFKALEYEPIDIKAAQKDGENYRGGWRIKRFKIVETSAVSIPANEDAIITGHSKGLFEHPFVKAMAMKKFEARPVIVPTGGEVPKETKDAGSCGCGTKDTKTDTKGMKGPIMMPLPPLEGSFESIGMKLEHELEEWLPNNLPKGADTIDPWDEVCIIATFADKVVACTFGWTPTPKSCYEVDWSMENGEPTPKGEPRPVEITTSVTSSAEKAYAAKHHFVPRTKDGKTTLVPAGADQVKMYLSKAKKGKLEDAKTLVNDVAKADGTTVTSKTLLEKAAGLIGDVIDTASTEPEEYNDTGEPKSVPADLSAVSVPDLGKHLSARLFLDDAVLPAAKAVREDLDQMIALVEKDKADRDIEAFLSNQ
jgi:hypothetical protein